MMGKCKHRIKGKRKMEIMREKLVLRKGGNEGKKTKSEEKCDTEKWEKWIFD